MPQKEDPRWEIVDELPGERKKRAAAQRPRPSRRLLWIGVAIGALAALALPPLRAAAAALGPALARSWWILAGVAAYLVWRRLQRRR